MMNNTNAQEERALPPLISLPVYRAAYCDQRTTDLVMTYLWDKEAELVADLAGEEKWPFPECRSAMYRKASHAIEYVLREKKIEGFNGAQTNLAILDLLFELSRRLRKAQGLKEIPVFGRPLAESPSGPYPPLIDKVVFHHEDWLPEQPAPDLIDRICVEAYQKNPALMYQLSEEQRRTIHTYETLNALHKLIEEIKEKESVASTYSFHLELQARLDKMCGVPSHEEMMKEIGS